MIANSGRGAHYDIMGIYDLIILAPQVRSYYRDEGGCRRLEYSDSCYQRNGIYSFNKDPNKALQFVLEHYQAV